MKSRSRSIIILSVLFGYVILQFLWWEILLVKQTGEIIELKQRVAEINSADEEVLKNELKTLHRKKQTKVIMVVGEGTVFLLLLVFGIYKIKQSYDKEDALNTQQKNFFLSITHELKTPIAATKLQLQTLQKHKLDPGKQNELIANALVETERLNALIDNVLLANRLDSEGFIFKKERENISELTESILNRYYKSEINKLELSFNIEKDLMLEIDKTVFPSIITNLVDNAIKYSFDKKNVAVELNKKDNWIRLTVSDTGAGIADGEKKKIFAKFYRAGNEEIRSAKGTGLGLYIVDYLVLKHNGNITVKNNIPKGSAFEILFNAS
jgi:K+-sensing histidine kinase KdpD